MTATAILEQPLTLTENAAEKLGAILEQKGMVSITLFSNYTDSDIHSFFIVKTKVE